MIDVDSMSRRMSVSAVIAFLFGDVVKPGGDFAEAQPLVSRHQALDVGGSDDLEVVFDRQRAGRSRRQAGRSPAVEFVRSVSAAVLNNKS